MKIKLDYPRLMQLSDSRGVHTLSELCRKSGVNYNYVRSSISRRHSFNIETYYQLARFLDCRIEDIMLPYDSDLK